MSEGKTKNPSKLSLSKEVKPDRVRWIDHARGFVMLYLVLTEAWPASEWQNASPILKWFTGHPGPYDIAWSLYDIGVPAFMILIGLSAGISFYKRLDQEGAWKAVRKELIRYGLLFLLGAIYSWVIGFEVTSNKIYSAQGPYTQFYGDPYTVVIWDIITALGLAGFCLIPFLFIRKPALRFIVGYVWLIIYGFLFFFTDSGEGFSFRAYAQTSVHGGIYGTIFTLTAITVIASALGEYLVKSPRPEKQKFIHLIIFTVVNLAVALVLHNYVPGWEATKRQGSMSYGLLGLGICGVGMVFFWGLDMIIKKPITYLAAFGKNPFLTYMICAVPAEVLDQLDMVDLGLGPWGNCITAVILLVLTSVIVVPMYKRNKIWSTEKATIVFIIVTVILAGLLIGLGVIEI